MSTPLWQNHQRFCLADSCVSQRKFFQGFKCAKFRWLFKGTAGDASLTQRKFHYQNCKLTYYMSHSSFYKKAGYFGVAVLLVFNIGDTILFSSKISLPYTAACNFMEGKKTNNKLGSKIERAQLFHYKWLKTNILWGNGEKGRLFWEQTLSI